MENTYFYYSCELLTGSISLSIVLSSPAHSYILPEKNTFPKSRHIDNKGGRSTNNFRKLTIRKFADLFFLFADLPQMWQFAICWLGFAICGLKITNLRICDCEMNQQFTGFAICGQTKKYECPPLCINN
jgi:hypothetical protein